jgi:dethiobiotin synthetase
MPAVFVAGTGTGVGKTHVACALIRAFRVRGLAVDALKPVVSGFDETDWTDSDPGRLLSALGRPLTPETLSAISPWRFEAPLSPDQAARMEGRSVAFDALVEVCRHGVAIAPGLLVIEGAGGVMSPISETATNLDLMVALGAPVVLAAGSYLGTISHTLTALEAFKARGVAVCGVVVSETDVAADALETAASIRRLATPARVIALSGIEAPESLVDAILGVVGG